MLKQFQSIPDRLRRITSGGKFINEIDGLRFIAIIPVLIQHFTERFERNTHIAFTTPASDNMTSFVAHRGFLGVYIFFVVSGFVLSIPFARHKLNNDKKVNLGQYYIRRLTRLEPPYIIWMTLLFIVFVIHGHNSFLVFLPQYFASITYTHALFYHSWSPINPPTWTLEVEVQFYIIAPVLTLLFFAIKNKITRRICNVLIIILFMIVQQYFELFSHHNLDILAHLQYFLVGFILTDIYLTDWKGIRRNSFYDFVAVLSFLALIFVWNWDGNLLSRILFAIALFLLVFSVFKGTYANKFVSNRWITAIGGMCYTIYLIHLPFAESLIIFTKNIHLTDFYSLNLCVQLLIFLPLALCLSSICFLLFEKPFMDKNWPSLVSAKVKNFFTAK